MPGAPNRPPETAPETPPPPPATDSPAKRVLRRLAPARVVLNLDLWKGAPSQDLLTPFQKAEAAYSAGEFPTAEGALDALAVRFAEPRWPSLPTAFQALRVKIAAPQPPQWDPEYSLAPAERDALRTRRQAAAQLTLADAAVAWAGEHGVDVSELTPRLVVARAEFERDGASGAFYGEIDPIWEAIRDRVPLPKAVATPPVVVRAAEPEVEEA